MTVEAVEEIVRREAEGNLSTVSHGITLERALMRPKEIVFLDRVVRDGRVTDKELSGWLVGRERSEGGYMIIMREEDFMFGLAHHGLPTDKHPILTGWYGSLLSTFVSM